MLLACLCRLSPGLQEVNHLYIIGNICRENILAYKIILFLPEKGGGGVGEAGGEEGGDGGRRGRVG